MSEERDTGGPAFPTESEGQTGCTTWRFEGMTLRDYFAAKAMHAFISEAETGTEFGTAHLETNLRYANAAFAMADAMLKARKQ